MKIRSFGFQTGGVRGLPAILLGGLVLLLVAGLVALLAMVGMAIFVGGLVLSTVAAIGYAVRRRFLGGGISQTRPTWDVQGSTHTVEAEAIEVEVLKIEDVRREDERL